MEDDNDIVGVISIERAYEIISILIDQMRINETDQSNCIAKLYDLGLTSDELSDLGFIIIPKTAFKEE